MVAEVGFGPTICDLWGRRPKPLDYPATRSTSVILQADVDSFLGKRWGSYSPYCRRPVILAAACPLKDLNLQTLGP